MKCFIVFLLNIALFFPFFFTKADPLAPYESEYSQLDSFEQAVWKISTLSEDENNELKRQPDGTGFFIGTNHFITNFHVIYPLIYRNKTIVFSQEGKSSILKTKRVLAVSVLYDLALLETEENVKDYLKLRDHSPEPNENLFLPTYSHGSFTKMRKTGDIIYEDSQIYDFPVNTVYLSGSSGSPVLDGQGQVVGVTFAGNNNILIAVKVNHLKEFIIGNTGTKCSASIDETRFCIEEEIENMEKSAEDSIYVQYNLANIYYSGLETEKYSERYTKQALQWYKRAAEQGYAPAQSVLAYMFENSEGTRKDFKQALQWYERAAEQAYVLAQYNLADMYYYGKGTQQDLMKAFYWMEKAAEQAYVLAQHKLARFYAYYADKGAQLYFSRMALQWFERAREQDYAPAHAALASYRETGMFNVKEYKLFPPTKSQEKPFLDYSIQVLF